MSGTADSISDPLDDDTADNRWSSLEPLRRVQPPTIALAIVIIVTAIVVLNYAMKHYLQSDTEPGPAIPP